MEHPLTQVCLYLVVSFLAMGYLLNVVLARLTVKSLDPVLPAEFEGWFDPKEYSRSQAYARARTRLSLTAETVEFALLLGFLLLGGFPLVDDWARSFGFGEVGSGLLFLGALTLLGSLSSLPFEAWETFVLEERYGFNRCTPRTFVMDRLKSLLLTALIGGPIVAALILFFLKAGTWGWLWAWIMVTAVSLLLQYLAPTLIMPLFNKFTPLDEGEIREALEAYARDQGVRLTGIFVMDGSQRSSKGNAMFTGFGAKKRIALFDTLVERHPTRELVAVLAHETGHMKLRHVPRLTIMLVLKLGLLLYLMSLFARSEPLHAAFGMRQVSVYAGLLFFLILYTPVSMLLSMVMHAVSRRFEYQADAFAARTTKDAEAMVDALKRLSVDNLSNLTPHPLVVALSYSHPPVLDRIKALRAMKDASGGWGE